jgi:1-aminocyclopropane-1-carboxylate deaminase
MRLAARLEAMITDPVYEGKSMAGLIDLINRGEIERE